MKKMSLFLTATALLGSLTLGTVALASPGRGDMSHHFMRAMKDLELTDEQKTELRAIREEARGDRDAHRAEMESIREAFLAELASDTPNAAALHDLVDRKNDLASEAGHARVDGLVKAHAVLTPEQRTELLTLMEERHEQRAERRGERGERGEGRRGGR